MIYIAHPYGGLRKNKVAVERIISKFLGSNPEQAYISPIHTFGHLYKKVDYVTGLNMCLALLSKCDGAVFCGDWYKSQGCRSEHEYCHRYKIPHEEEDV